MEKQQIPSPEQLPITFKNIHVTTPDGEPTPDVPPWIWEVDHPYLHGLFAPVANERSSDELVVEQGEVPKDLDGIYVLNGPNQRYKPLGRYHYYDGDGMLHATYFSNGNVSYKSKWIRTEAFVEEEKQQRAVWPGLCGPFNHDLPGSPIKDNSNTDIIFYQGKLMSLWYLAGSPQAIDPINLTTLGQETLNDTLTHNLSAHSKVDPRTGDLVFFNYQDVEPFMTYGVANAKTGQRTEVPIDLPGPRSPHDMGITEHYSILHDLPYFHDAEVLAQHKKRVVRFHSDIPARFGVIPRFGKSEDVHWFEAAPCYVLHLVNCWEEDDTIVMVGCRQDNPGGKRDSDEGPLASQLAERRRSHELHEWRLHLKTGETTERVLNTLNLEFPTINSRFAGVPNRFSYLQALPESPKEGAIEGRCQTFDALVKYDYQTGEIQSFDYGSGVSGSESWFAPKAGSDGESAEDDGYVITYTHSRNDWVSRCLIFDAKNISKGPIATVRMPRRFNIGFHGVWVQGEELSAAED
jgi:carotenoid cleavage dioxygenase-like enzyme